MCLSVKNILRGRLSFNYSDPFTIGLLLRRRKLLHTTHTRTHAQGIARSVTANFQRVSISVTNLLAASWCGRMQSALLSDERPSGFLQVIVEDAH